MTGCTCEAWNHTYTHPETGRPTAVHSESCDYYWE